jgi:hypothetical protein
VGQQCPFLQIAALFAAEAAPAAIVEPGTINVHARVPLTVEFRSE